MLLGGYWQNITFVGINTCPAANFAKGSVMNGFLNKSRAGNLAGKTFLLVGCLLIGTTAAQAAVESEVVFVFNTFSFLLWGALVMWMCAGFTMLESGSVRTKNASMICLKNIGLYSIAGLAYYFIGYNLMYVDVGSVIGSLKFLYGQYLNPDIDDVRHVETQVLHEQVVSHERVLPELDLYCYAVLNEVGLVVGHDRRQSCVLDDPLLLILG